jgi:flagellar assembly factor FliW
MLRILTRFFGELDCNVEDLYTFPSGLPGFEDQQSFFFLKIPRTEPLLFMQSMTTRSLCFVLLPILVVEPDYKVRLTVEELSELQLPADRIPAIGKDVLCAVTVCFGNGTSPTVNLMAPVIVNLHTKIGLQAIHGDSGYSHQHPLRFKDAMVSC